METQLLKQQQQRVEGALQLLTNAISIFALLVYMSARQSFRCETPKTMDTQSLKQQQERIEVALQLLTSAVSDTQIQF